MKLPISDEVCTVFCVEQGDSVCQTLTSEPSLDLQQSCFSNNVNKCLEGPVQFSLKKYRISIITWLVSSGCSGQHMLQCFRRACGYKLQLLDLRNQVL